MGRGGGVGAGAVRLRKEQAKEDGKVEATKATEQEIKDLKDELEELQKQLEAEEAKTAQPVTTDVPEVTIAG